MCTHKYIPQTYLCAEGLLIYTHVYVMHIKGNQHTSVNPFDENNGQSLTLMRITDLESSKQSYCNSSPCTILKAIFICLDMRMCARVRMCNVAITGKHAGQCVTNDLETRSATAFLFCGAVSLLLCMHLHICKAFVVDKTPSSIQSSKTTVTMRGGSLTESMPGSGEVALNRPGEGLLGHRLRYTYIGGLSTSLLERRGHEPEACPPDLQMCAQVPEFHICVIQLRLPIHLTSETTQLEF